jgi:hypothetical protein
MTFRGGLKRIRLYSVMVPVDPSEMTRTADPCGAITMVAKCVPVIDSSGRVAHPLGPCVESERSRQLAELATALEALIQKKKSTQRGWFVRFLLKLLPPPEPYPSDDLEAILSCVRDTEFQSQYDENAARTSHDLRGGRADDFWVYFRSDRRSWKNLGGRGGWLVLCRGTLRQKAFFQVEMN